MKRLFILTCAILFAVAVQAQEHMTFKGLPMNCDLASFVSQLEAKGYTKLSIDEDSAFLSGSFAGKDNCTIIVLCTTAAKLVWKVAVYFPEQTSWHSLKSEYNSFKQSYTEKYGTPRSYEFFSDPYYEGDTYELQALRLDKCTYSSFYDTPAGYIGLSISSTKKVCVSYEDAINVVIKRNEKKKAVSNDI